MKNNRFRDRFGLALSRHYKGTVLTFGLNRRKEKSGIVVVMMVELSLLVPSDLTAGLISVAV